MTLLPAAKLSPKLGPLALDEGSLDAGIDDSVWAIDVLQSAKFADQAARTNQFAARPPLAAERSRLNLAPSSPAESVQGHVHAQDMSLSLSSMSSTMGDVPSLVSSTTSESSPSSSSFSPDRSRQDSHSLQHRRRQSNSRSLLPSADLSSPARSATSFLTPAPAVSPVGYTHRTEPSWFAEQQSTLLDQATYAQSGPSPSTPPRVRAVDGSHLSITPRALAATSHMYRSPSAHSVASSPTASPFISAQAPPMMSSHSMQAGLSQMSSASYVSSLSSSALNGSGLAAFDTPSRARFSRMAINEAREGSSPATDSDAVPYLLQSAIPLADLAEGAVPVQLEATKEMEQLLDELGQYLPADSVRDHLLPPRPPAPQHTVSAPPAQTSNTIEINGVSLAPEDLALLDGTDFNEPVRQYPSSAPPWQTTFDIRPPATPPPHRAVSRQSHFVIPHPHAPAFPAQRAYVPHAVAARPATYHESSSSYHSVPTQISGQRRRRSSIDFTRVSLQAPEPDVRQRSTSANPERQLTETYAYEQTFRIPRPQSHYGSFDQPTYDGYQFPDGTPTTPRRYARVPARQTYSPASSRGQPQYDSPQFMPPVRAVPTELILTRSLSARASPAQNTFAVSPRRGTRSPAKPSVLRRNNQDADSSVHQPEAQNTSSPTKPRQSNNGGGVMFVNYSAQDKKKLLNGVAPSGSSKRRREAEAAAAAAAETHDPF
ncbi:hypothetical protein OIV83_001231 [Microbotryomycetes sp. JL201]|nr:hypothetical protein OIV83_001231 [Microbotryomycetes sp. JL201]